MEYITIKKYPKATVYMDKNSNEIIKRDTTFEYDTIKNSIKVPKIAVDTTMQSKWLKDKNYIMKNKNKTLWFEADKFIKPE